MVGIYFLNNTRCLGHPTYETVTGKIRRVEPVRGVIRLEADHAAGSCLEIRMKDILEIRAEEEE